MIVPRVHPEALAAGGPEWTWCVARGAEPGPDTLSTLLDHATGPVVLVAGWVDGAIPRSPQTEPEAVIAAAQQHTLPLRSCTLACTLVHVSAIERAGLPDRERYGPLAEHVWTWRVLQSAAGLFVPHARAAGHIAGGRATPAQAVRARRAGAFTPGEALRALR